MTAPSPALPAIDPIAINAVLIAVRQAAQLLCDRATLLVLLHAHAGASTYSDLAQRTALPSRVLSARLAQLSREELLVRMPYSRRPLRHAYHPSHMGADLFDVLALCAAWEADWPHPAHVGAPALQVRHLGCAAPEGKAGARAAVAMHCAACGGPVDARAVALRVSQREIAAMPRQGTGTRRSSQGAAQPDAASGPIAQSLVVLGDKWGIEVLVCAFFRVHRFGEFAAHTGIASNILSNRLERLTRIGLLARDAASAPQRRATYALTPKGRAFYPVLVAIQRWADDWLEGRVRSPVKLRHAPCGQTLRPVLVCGHCGERIDRSHGRLLLGTP